MKTGIRWLFSNYHNTYYKQVAILPVLREEKIGKNRCQERDPLHGNRGSVATTRVS